MRPLGTRECAPYVQENVPLSSLCNGFAPYVLENMPLVFIYLGFNLGFFIYVEGLSKKKFSSVFFIASIQARRDPLLNAQLRHVCRATSAAPTYFPPVQFSVVDKTKEPPESREYNMIDGGIAVNNPVKLLSSENFQILHLKTLF